LFRGYLDKLRDAWRVRGSRDPLPESGDFPGTYGDLLESKEGLGKFRRGPLSVGKDLGMEIAFLHAGNFEVLHRPTRPGRSQV